MTYKILQIIVSMALLFLLFTKAPYKEIIIMFQKTRIEFFIPALIVAILATLINTRKWYYLIPEIFFFRLLTYNLLAVFYSIIFSGQLSGEIVKAYKLSKNSHKKTEVIASIAGDKASGLFILFLAGLFTYPLTALYLPNIALILFIIIISGIISILASFYLPLTKVINYLLDKKLFSKNQFLVLGRKYLQKFVIILQIYQEYKRPFVFFKILFLSLIYQVLAAISFLLITKSLDIDISFIEIFWVFALISILLFLPISLAGLGIREGAMVYLFSAFQIPAHQALAASLALFSISIIMGASGLFLKHYAVNQK